MGSVIGTIQNGVIQDGVLSPVSYFGNVLSRGSILGVGEAHWYAGLFEEITKIMLSPQLDGLFQKLFVEFGNSAYQELLDSYINGGNVAFDDLSCIWLDSVSFPAWLHPCYGMFFKQVRDANKCRSYPVQIILSEPPIEWSKVKTDKHLKQLNGLRDQALFHKVNEETKGGKEPAIVFFGAKHILNKTPQFGRFKCFGEQAKHAFGETYHSVWPHMLSGDGYEKDHQMFDKPTSGGVIKTTDVNIRELCLCDVLPNRSAAGSSLSMKLPQVMDAYLYLGPQSRQFEVNTLSSDWNEILRQRLGFLNPRQKEVVSRVLNKSSAVVIRE
ncbi:hypothetical protein [Vibrio tapetis]|uniref:Uncharacterized protein n=1 Tax=Vibrio tapetis subsp. tapetis TaxID=1671868 RepID=A0A2N8ZM56_9VIBR|nr:hypothetical protein [Vibrio tapetis]SON52994.1 conserved protein of unknown function [Vibrio tapetis subsp. tapetis]